MPHRGLLALNLKHIWYEMAAAQSVDLTRNLRFCEAALLDSGARMLEPKGWHESRRRANPKRTWKDVHLTGWSS